MRPSYLRSLLTTIAKRAGKCGVALFILGFIPAASAEQAYLAVATNFRHAAESLTEDFETTTGHTLTLTTGSTGKLYAQIVHGAPFDVFLAADTTRPQRLETTGQAVLGSRQTYAIGQLVLWSKTTPQQPLDGPAYLTTASFRNLAMANPALAPYGAAARQVLQNLGLQKSLQRKIVMGQNIGQAFALVATGNAELGFVALSNVQARPHQQGAYWLVPQDLYTPIQQQGVLLTRAKNNKAAIAFMAYLRSPRAQNLIIDYGYQGTQITRKPAE